jgi:hypothetical protein
MSGTEARESALLKFREQEPVKFRRYLMKLEHYARALRESYEAGAVNEKLATVLMKYVRLMADTPEVVDCDERARVMLNDRILFLKKMLPQLGMVDEETTLGVLVKRIIAARGTTEYAW